MGVFKGSYDLHKEAHRDAIRHKEKLKDAFKERLHDIISEENIITSDGNKKVKVPIKSLDNYKFIFDPYGQKQTGQGDGNTQEGDIVGREKLPGQGQGKGSQPGKPGQDEGEDIYEAEIDLDELVEMMLEDLKLPRLDPKKKADVTAKETRWNDIAKHGVMSNLDKKRTIIENMKRNAKVNGVAKVEGINRDDLRFRTWTEVDKPITNAVIFAIMDVSASMYEMKKYIARSFYFWMTQFLRKKYSTVEIVFIAHTTTAKVVTEQDFFHKVESGGTKCSSGYELALQMINDGYPNDSWNTFVFHFSDGETWADEAECVRLIGELTKVSNMVGYGEIDIEQWDRSAFGYSTLYRYYASQSALLSNPKYVQAYITDKTQVYQVLQRFFGEELNDKDDLL